jgi:chemotaxis protein methyltransferase CheR
MSIYVTETNSGYEICILGEYLSAEDTERFFYELKHINSENIKITMFDIETVNADFIMELTDYMEKNPQKKIKIFIFKRSLSSYLMKLGVKNTFLEQKSTKTETKKGYNYFSIVGSADSLDSIMYIIEKLICCNATMFIAQHLSKDDRKLLSELVSKRTDCEVVNAKDNEPVRKKVIYVAPGGLHMEVIDGKIRLSDTEKYNYAKPSFSVLMKSLSREYKEKYCAVILSGFGNDGADALSLLKSNKSFIIIENPKISKANELLNSCIEKNCHNKIMDTKDIPEFINSNLALESLPDKEFLEFLENINKKYGFDFSNYNISSIKRRIKVAMLNCFIYNFNEYKNKVYSSKQYFNDLFIELSVNVSEFFRAPLVFKEIKDKIIPMLDSFPQIKIWSAGCAGGEEAYTLAIVLKEAGVLHKSLIYATDINSIKIEEAKNGIYSYEELIKSEKNYKMYNKEGNFITKYFKKKKDYAVIDESLQKNILFFQHSLVNSGVLNEFQIILCRNVIIYFNNTLKNEIMNLIKDSLDISGFFISGEKEDIMLTQANEQFKPFNKEQKIYKHNT